MKSKREPKEQPVTTVLVKSESRDVLMAPADVALDELEAGEVPVKRNRRKDSCRRWCWNILGTTFCLWYGCCFEYQGILADPNLEQDESEKVEGFLAC